MPSLVSGYTYDIFISYRHNDNRAGWVTEFVKALQDELAATVKDPVSIYFDKDAHEGLLETHEVKESLDGKLKAVILIPIISQTYCDPRSYAFSNEFKVFHQIALKDWYGLKIKTGSNVTSRIIPVRIHDLDPVDRQTLESILAGPLRGVDFIYRTEGFTRPLKSAEEEPKNNLNQTFYHDQVIKLVRAIKEVQTGMRELSLDVENTKIKAVRPKIELKLPVIIGFSIILAVTVGYFFFFNWQAASPDIYKSIAVLPFENMNKDSTQDYFSNGITEDILNHLTTVSGLNVKSRTSTLQYAGSKKSVVTIGNELDVSHVLEGSVRKVGNKVRIVVQLIDAKLDVHLWSKTYDRELEDIFALQSDIAIQVVKELQAEFSNNELQQLKKQSSTSFSAYDYYLRAKNALVIDPSREEARKELSNILVLLNKAIALDPKFADAFALKARVWFVHSGVGIPQHIWLDSAMLFSDRAIELDPTDADGYLEQAQVLRYIGKMDEARILIRKAYENAPGNHLALGYYGYQLLRDRDSTGAKLVLRYVENEYSKTDPFYFLEWSSIFAEFEKL